MKNLYTIPLAFCLLNTAFSENVKTSMTTSAKINSSCIISVGNYSFGVLDTSTAITQNVRLTCNKDTLLFFNKFCEK